MQRCLCHGSCRLLHAQHCSLRLHNTSFPHARTNTPQVGNVPATATVEELTTVLQAKGVTADHVTFAPPANGNKYAYIRLPPLRCPWTVPKEELAARQEELKAEAAAEAAAANTGAAKAGEGGAKVGGATAVGPAGWGMPCSTPLPPSHPSFHSSFPPTEPIPSIFLTPCSHAALTAT